MIVDSSALIAVLQQEPDAQAISAALESSAERVAVSAATLFEASIIADRARDPSVGRRFDQICAQIGFEVIPFDENQARIAREAYRDFGRGSGHPARLNFGDCFAYAAAKALDEPLLYKGTDFGQTDVRSVLP